VERFGTPAQRCIYYVGAASDLLARQRYAYSPEALKLCRGAPVEAPADTLPLNQRGLARLLMGFSLISGAKSDRLESLDWLRKADEDARDSGDATLSARVLTYWGLALVRLGDATGARLLAQRGRLVAEAAQIRPYLGACIAYEGWAAWREGNEGLALPLLLEARQVWQQHPQAFPFQWVATLPLLDLQLAREKLELLPSLLTALLEPHQQALSQPLVETISEALQGCSIGDGPVVHRKVCAVLDLARQQQYV
jgi:hypothetical protein